MRSRAQIEQVVDQTDLFAEVDIKEITKEAKIGWLKALILVAVWPIIKALLAKKISAKVIAVIDEIVNGY